ncbi:hypothetical protein E2C01_055792 [Portunus trituberculatus]|uniref:Uncharacterized protein n=1 Tax=Portunus trituberculatus TaxID=210409 RepID=A0A5B7GWX7_PORTR|nr:hypothetical protein [Portunus trituberculatus]
MALVSACTARLLGAPASRRSTPADPPVHLRKHLGTVPCVDCVLPPQQSTSTGSKDTQGQPRPTSSGHSGQPHVLRDCFSRERCSLVTSS